VVSESLKLKLNLQNDFASSHLSCLVANCHSDI